MMRGATVDEMVLLMERKGLLALLHRRVSQLTWTNTSDPITDIQTGIALAQLRARPHWAGLAGDAP